MLEVLTDHKGRLQEKTRVRSLTIGEARQIFNNRERYSQDLERFPQGYQKEKRRQNVIMNELHPNTKPFGALPSFGQRPSGALKIATIVIAPHNALSIICRRLITQAERGATDEQALSTVNGSMARLVRALLTMLSGGSGLLESICQLGVYSLKTRLMDHQQQGIIRQTQS